ncbi:MAG: Do family serine endopeptidase [Terriglobia bacterium]|nr:Do family serine endopeptidase [Terriglobia bacterium]
MPNSTNQLVTKRKEIAATAALVSAVLVGAILPIQQRAHAAVPATPLNDRSVAALTSLDQAMESIAARVTPSVVNIAVTSKGSPEQAISDDDQQGLPPGLEQFFGRLQPQHPQPLQHGVGSGVIISPDGYIITNNHVVDGAVRVQVTLNDRRTMNARIVGVDKLTDLAVLKINATHLPAIAWGDSTKLQPGETVLAFGSPFGYFRFSVTRGIVSALDRPNPYSNNPRKPGDFIQTDAAINPGNSGGPLVNARGELVGIDTFIVSESGSFAGAGFAIPSQIVRSVAEQLMKSGSVRHGYLGMSMNDVTPDNARFFNLHDASGAIVSAVVPNSPASRAGLRRGDVIRQLNGEKIVDGSALQVAVSEETPGTNITLGILRNGNPQTLDLTVGEYHPNAQEASDSDEAAPQGAKIGLGVVDLTPELRQQLQLPDHVQGIAIQSVRPGSPAEDAGLAPGDVILEVNRKAVTSAKQFVGAVHANPSENDMLLLVWSQGNTSYRTIHPESPNQNG